MKHSRSRLNQQDSAEEFKADHAPRTQDDSKGPGLNSSKDCHMQDRQHFRGRSGQEAKEFNFSHTRC